MHFYIYRINYEIFPTWNIKHNFFIARSISKLTRLTFLKSIGETRWFNSASSTLSYSALKHEFLWKKSLIVCYHPIFLSLKPYVSVFFFSFSLNYCYCPLAIFVIWIYLFNAFFVTVRGGLWINKIVDNRQLFSLTYSFYGYFKLDLQVIGWLFVVGAEEIGNQNKKYIRRLRNLDETIFIGGIFY